MAFCLFKYFPYGGLERDMLRIALACHSRGYEIDIYTTAWEGEVPPSLRVHLHPATAWTNHGAMREFHAWLTGQLAQHRPACVVGFQKMPGLDLYYAADVCYRAKALEQHSRLYRFLPRYRLYQAFEEAVFGPHSRTQVLTITPTQEKRYVAHYGTPAGRLHRLPPNVARSRMAGPDAPELRRCCRRSLGRAESDRFLLQVGSAFRTKGLDRSIRALAGLPAELRARTWLYVVGHGATRPYARLARRYGVADRVVFLGPREDVSQLMIAADLLVHPARVEAAGIVLLEALACGLGVVASGVCGYAPFVEQAQAGWILPEPFNQSVFNRAVQAALARDDLAEVGRRGLEFARREDLYGMVDAAVAVIEATARRGNSKHQIPNSKQDSMTKTSNPKPARGAFGIWDLVLGIWSFFRPGRKLWLSDRLRTLWEGRDPFAQVERLSGEVFRQMASRKTMRVTLGDAPYFAKIHSGVGWREILKNLLYLRWPVLGAAHEWRALRLLHEIGVDTLTPAAFGQMGSNPARIKSFLITEELRDTISLEDLCAAWPAQSPSFRLRKALTERLAAAVRQMHTHGLNHRDCYLCHFHLGPSGGPEPRESGAMRLYVIDLHRAQIRRRTPQRWSVKDLAGLYFSAMDVGITRTDRLRFIRAYEDRPLRDVFRDHRGFWRRVEQTACALHQKLTGRRNDGKRRQPVI